MAGVRRKHATYQRRELNVAPEAIPPDSERIRTSAWVALIRLVIPVARLSVHNSRLHNLCALSSTRIAHDDSAQSRRAEGAFAILTSTDSAFAGAPQTNGVRCS